MIKIDLMLAEQPFTIMFSGQQIVQIFHNQQAISFDNPRENYYQFNLDNKLIGIDSTEVNNQSISLFVDDVFATQLALPAPVNNTPKKGLPNLVGFFYAY